VPELPANEGLSPDQFISMERAIGVGENFSHLNLAQQKISDKLTRM
jgi:hypothetical protein